MPVKPGDLLCDRFRIDTLIGRGGMGQVFAATDLKAPEAGQVAIKIVSRLLVDDVLMHRLHREAEAAARIRSDYVPRVFELGDTDDGEMFLVMERLVGEPLSQRIRDNGALPWSEVARIGEDILRGLIDAHTAGIIHRDLKPSNVFLAVMNGRVRTMVLDFGVCKIDKGDKQAERLTATGESIGTVAYMAPEQIRGAARVDERADLFAFGVLVFEMLTGRLPHEGPSQMAILASKLENPAASLSRCARVAIPPGVHEVVMRALERDPAARFASAQELLRAWRALYDSPHQPLAQRTPADPIAVLSSRNVMDAGSSDDVGGGASEPFLADPATERSRGPRVLVEPHATQTSLTTHSTSMGSIGAIGRASGNTRLALLLAAAGLVAGIAVVGVSFTRTDAPELPEVHPAPAASTAEPPVAPATAETAAVVTPADLLELPADPAPSGAPRGRVLRRPPSRPGPAAPKASGPHITSQPRY